MARYWRRPELVEAVQFDPCGVHRTKLPIGVLAVDRCGGADNYAYEGVEFSVVTMNGGKMPVVAGDWIITESDGIHHRPCKPEVFRELYEPETERDDKPDEHER